MSLAEDLPRSYIGSLSRSPQKLARVSLADLAGKGPQDSALFRKSASDLLAQPVHEAPAREAAAVVAMPRRTERANDGDTSLELLDRASKGMSFILNRYKQLEDHVKQVDSWANAQIQAAEAAAAQWQEAAAAAEKRLDEAQRNLDLMARRAETAEQAMTRDKQALTVLQDRIIEAFGFGSEAHDAINAGLQIG